MFDEQGETEETPAASTFAATETGSDVDISGGAEDTNVTTSTDMSPGDSSAGGFELLDDDDVDAGAGDPELDELEAEIARELED